MTRAPATIGTVIVLALGLTACAVHGQVTTGTPPPPATAGPAPGSATSSTFGSGEALAYDCRQLVGTKTLAKLDPDLAPESDLIAANDSPTEEVLALRGTVCAWSDTSAAIVLVITAAKPDAPTLATLRRPQPGTATPSSGTRSPRTRPMSNCNSSPMTVIGRRRNRCCWPTPPSSPRSVMPCSMGCRRAEARGRRCGPARSQAGGSGDRR